MDCEAFMRSILPLVWDFQTIYMFPASGFVDEELKLPVIFC
jgi:hypothetical protein